MTRFTRVLLVAMMAFVLSFAVTSVSSADGGKRGTTVNVQKQGMLTPGHSHQVSPSAAQGESFGEFGQYFNYSLFFYFLFLYSKVFFRN
jgi:hypothetical protein